MTYREYILIASVSCVVGLFFWLAYSVAANDTKSEKANAAKDPK